MDTDTLRPLSKEYSSLMYTRAMQEFLAKTADDFGDAAVINLDEDKETNFLVLNDGNLLIKEEAGQNRLVSYDEESDTYTFADVSDSVKGLKQGDIFLYQYDENEWDFYIIKVEQIELQETDGVTVAIIAAAKDALGAEEIFQHVRIDEVSGTADMEEITQEDCPEGVTYLGRESGAVGYAIEGDPSLTIEKDFWQLPREDSDDHTFGDYVSGKFGGNILAGFGATFTLEYYLDWELLYVDIGAKIEASMEGSIEAKGKVEIPLITSPLEIGDENSPFTISFTPKFFVEGEISATVNLGISGYIGLKVGAGKMEGEDFGPYNGLELDLLKIDAKAEVSLGIKFDPQLKVSDVFNAELETGAVVAFTAEVSNNNSFSSEDGWEEHDCGLNCIAMSGNFDIPLSGELKVLKWKEYDLAELVDVGADGSILEIEFGECYYSIKHKKFGWGECPYNKYRVTAEIMDKYNWQGVAGAIVKQQMFDAYALKAEDADVRLTAAAEGEEPVSDSNGVLTMWLPAGEYTLNVIRGDEVTPNKVKVDGSKKLLLRHDYVEEKVYVSSEMSASSGFAGMRRKDGSLWMWGNNGLGQVGIGTDDYVLQHPVKVLGDVMEVALGGDTCLAVKGDSSLWTWGNWPGHAENDKRKRPFKLMEEVETAVTRNGICAVTKKDGSLWMWGYNDYGQLGNGTQDFQDTPVRVAVQGHVREVRFSNDGLTVAAICEDGSLWMWGKNESGQVGNGTRENQLTPVKVLSQVAHVESAFGSADIGRTAAVTEDGSLYMWGSNSHCLIGNGNDDNRSYQLTPVEVMDGVSDDIISAIQKDGTLWTWGDNYWGEVGNDTTNQQMGAFKLMEGIRKYVAGAEMAVIGEDGALWTWGRNSWGTVGNSTTDAQLTPYKALDGVRECICDSNTMYALKEGGSLWAWGLNRHSQTGNPSNDTSGSSEILTIPTQVPFSENTQTLAEPIDAFSEDVVEPDVDTSIALAAQTASAGSPAQFSGLLANEIYNFYVVKTRNMEEVLAPDNLLYIGQYTSDENGSLSVPYVMREDYDTPEVFVVGLARHDLSAAQIVVPDIVYDGSGHVVEADVSFDGKTLKEGVDYEIYGTCLVTEPGEYHVEIRGCGDYCGAVPVTFHVNKDGSSDPGDNPGDISGGTGDDPDPDRNDVLPEDVPADGKIPDDIWIAGLNESGYPYTGSAIKPAVRVYDGKILLKGKVDYTISYKNHTKANDVSVAKTAPTVTVTGKGNYSGKDTAVYKILPLDISGEAFGADDMTLAYNKKAQKPIPALWWGSKKLKNKTDYTVAYYNKEGSSLDAFQDTGDYEIELTGKGNFTGKRRIALHVTADLKLMSKMSVAKILSQTYLSYNGGPVIPAVTVKDGKTVLTEGTHYTVSYSNNTKIGTGYVIVKGLEAGGYSGTKRVSFKIAGVSIAKATVSGLSGQTFIYGGTDIVPALKLSVKSGNETKTLTEEDYSVSWQKNRNAGTATVIFTGNQKKGYTGTVKKTFKIRAFNIAENAEGRFQAELEEKSAPYAKGGSRPKICVTFKRSDGILETLQEGKDYTLTCTNNKAVNDGSDARKLPAATIKGKGNFTGTFVQKLNYTITTQDIGRLSMNAADKTYQNKKNIFSTKVTITDLDGKTLKVGTDYEKQFIYTYKEKVTLDNGTVREAGAAVDKNDIIPAGTVLEVSVTGKKNYTGTLKGTYRIAKASISGAKVTIPVQTYTGRRVAPGKDAIAVKVRGQQQVDSSQYEIVSYQNNIKKGNASVTIRGVDNYGGTKNVQFKIRAKGLLWWWR